MSEDNKKEKSNITLVTENIVESGKLPKWKEWVQAEHVWDSVSFFSFLLSPKVKEITFSNVFVLII
jgi:hypothetical protein